MIYFNIVIIAVLLGLLIKSLILTIKNMESTRKKKLNGIIVIFLFILIFTSVISFNPGQKPAENFSGFVGHFISRSLYNAFGTGSYIIPLIILIGGIALVIDRVKSIFFRYGGAYILIFVIFFLIQSIYPDLSALQKGEFGVKTGNFLIDKLNFSGSIVLIVFLFILGIYIYLQFSFPLEKFKKLFSKIKIKRKTVEETPAERDSTKTRKKKKVTRRKKTKKKKIRRKRPEKKKEPVKVKKYDATQKELQNIFLKILNDPVEKEWMSEERIEALKQVIEKKLENFGITGEIENVLKGPVITRFEYKPDPGIKLSKISNLSSDLALALKAEKIRVIAPIPGKGVVGIEVPNDNREIVYIKDMIDNDIFKNNSEISFVPIGKNITGNPYYSSISSMPHLLIAGSTGSGKSVFINSMLTSLLYKARPEELRLILIDPKRIELSIYNGIPHLLRSVITDQTIAVNYLQKAIQCMEKRYEEFARVGVRDIKGYNRKMRDKKPYIFLIVDELADLMIRSGKDVERAITRLAQMSRAVGIHLILATQRPSVDVITGLIKANFPARVAFQVASSHDSKTIMDSGGAEKLLGNGDMLYTPPDEGISKRLHGPLISTDETRELVYKVGLTHLRNLLKKEFKEPDKICNLVEEEEILDVISDRTLPGAGERLEEFSKLLKRKLNIEEEKFTEFIEQIDYYPPSEDFVVHIDIDGSMEELEEVDEYFQEAKEIVIDRQSASVSLLQRKLKVGYARAGRIIDQLEKAGIVGKFRGSKPRKVLVKKEEQQ